MNAANPGAGELHPAEAAEPQAMMILASGSRTRRDMLARAGLRFQTVRSAVSEPDLKLALRAEGASAAEAAIRLAEMKALQVAARFPDRLVLGADQILVHQGEWLDKPSDREAAEAQLRRLRGDRHSLETAACLVRDGERVWHHCSEARLRLRDFSDAFLAAYLDALGEGIYSSVGAYQIEGLGAQLLAEVQGDFFSVLGLPLVPLLDQLRELRFLNR